LPFCATAPASAPAPGGGVWTELDCAALNNSGMVAFEGRVQDDTGEHGGVYLAAGGTVVPVALHGQTVSGTDSALADGLGERAGFARADVTDPEQVLALLKKCADEHREVLRNPAPMAFFENFGDSALMFNLRVSLPDIARGTRVRFLRLGHRMVTMGPGVAPL